MRYTFILFVVFLACNKKITDTNVQNLPKSELMQLYDQMAGHYLSKSNVGLDSAYHDRSLFLIKFNPFQNSDGLWLYSETIAPKNPASQKIKEVYKLYQAEKLIAMKKYSIEFVKDEVDKTNLSYLEQLDSNQYLEQKGCTIYFSKKSEGVFSGFTLLKNCINRYKGTTYMSIEMKSSDSDLIYHERGFDEYNKLLWGTRKQGVHYIKQ